MSGDYDASFEALHRELQAEQFEGGCAIGLSGIGHYQHSEFLKRCKQYPELIPIAGVNPLESNDYGNLKAMGYYGVKLHSRISKFDLQEHQPEIVNALRGAADEDLVVFFCTYFAAPLLAYPANDPLFLLVQILKQAPDTKVVLMHGGTVRLLQYADVVRFNPNLLLDLSYTMMRYRGSSVEADVRFLFRTLDRKVCIGSDHPEIKLSDLKKAFAEMTLDLPTEKVENIGFRNLLKFLNLPQTKTEGDSK